MKSKIYDYIFIIILVLSIIFGLYRFYPYFFSDVPLGYDPGLYRRMFIDYFSSLPYVDFASFRPRTREAYPPYIGLMGNTFHIIGYNVDFLITYMLAIFGSITSIYIYLYLKKYSQTTAIIGIIIFFISIIQYESFYLNYYKQILGIIFMLVGLYLLEKKKYLLSIPIIISMFTVNRPAGVFFVIMLVFYVLYDILVGIFKSKKSILLAKDCTFIKTDKTIVQKLCGFASLYNRNILYILLTVLFSGIIALFMYLPLIDEQILSLIKPLTTTFLVSGTSGTFFSLEDFVGYNFFIIILSIYGIYVKIQKRDFDFTTIGYLVGLLWIIFRLFFYNRFLITFDIYIILIAAYGLGHLYSKKKLFLFIFVLFFGIQSYIYIDYLNENGIPFIPKSEFELMQKLDTMLPNDSMIMVTHRHYTPRLFGYTDLPVIAPSMFEYDLWEKSDWNNWLASDGIEKCKMINDYKIYNKDIYIWLGVDQIKENLDGADCFEIIYESGENKVLRVKN
ncbi:MAG: hypothetical protein Q8K30_03345 [Candidatus Gracilibacteria bacterium]|nr:hypothetical protein [Candidatus Gracilibacteria bacterium]